MSNEPKAFPGSTQDGLTMRDYFAAKAMQGFCVIPPGEKRLEFWDYPYLAKHAYKIADAMMRARGEG